MDDFEDWEAYAELREAEDYEALVKLCENEVAQFPHDCYAQHRLGDAYVRNGQPERAIEYIGGCHRAFPENLDFHYVLLDALFALGKTEDDFRWVQKPVVLRLGRRALDLCYEYLKPKREPRSFLDVMTHLEIQAYVTFSGEELLHALTEDGRFVVEASHDAVFAEIRVARKKDLAAKRPKLGRRPR